MPGAQSPSPTVAGEQVLTAGSASAGGWIRAQHHRVSAQEGGRQRGWLPVGWGPGGLPAAASKARPCFGLFDDMPLREGAEHSGCPVDSSCSQPGRAKLMTSTCPLGSSWDQWGQNVPHVLAPTACLREPAQTTAPGKVDSILMVLMGDKVPTDWSGQFWKLPLLHHGPVPEPQLISKSGFAVSLLHILAPSALTHTPEGLCTLRLCPREGSETAELAAGRGPPPCTRGRAGLGSRVLQAPSVWLEGSPCLPHLTLWGRL